MTRGLEIRRKRELHPIRWLIWFIVALAIVAGAWFGYRYFTQGELPPFVAVSALTADPDINETPVTVARVAAHTVPDAEPRYLSVSSLTIGKTRVKQIGVDKNNLLEMPKMLDDVGWYHQSTTPGNGFGAVVIVGHNEGVTRNGTFARLGGIALGDIITIERGDGQKFRYEVADKRVMPVAEFAKSGMGLAMQSAEPDKEGLSLVTTSGNWVPRYQQFDERLVVRAVKLN